MSFSPHFTEQAEKNLKEICNYIINVLQSPKAKNDLIDAIDKKLSKICAMPTAYQICEYPPLRLLQIRYAIVKKYKMYFYIDENANTINVLYIKHQLQDERKLSDIDD